MTVNDKDLKKFLNLLETLEKKPKGEIWYKNQIFSGKLSPAFVLTRGFKDFYNSQVFRARSLSEMEDPTDIKSFKYPPIKYNKLGRANLKSKQVFYGANDPATAMLEYINTGNSKQTIHLARWKFKKTNKLPTYDISEFEESVDYLKWKWSENSTFKTLELVKTIHSKLINLYRNDNYNFTAPWSHFLLYKHNICEMIKYPSVVTDSQSKNYAINIDYFDENFYLDKVYVIETIGKINMSDCKEKNDLMVVASDKPIKVGEVCDKKVVYRNFNDEDNLFWEYYTRHIKE